MHDLIFAVAFVAMVTTPAMVAAIGGRKEYNPVPSSPSIRPAVAIRAMNVRPGARALNVRPAIPNVRVSTTVRRRTVRRVPAPANRRLVMVDGPTLPMHNARGMAGR
jgi:hypothetical protein